MINNDKDSDALKSVTPVERHTNAVVDVSFSSRNNFLVSASVDKTILVFVVDSSGSFVDEIKFCRKIDLNGFPLMIKFPPPVSDVLAGSHDEIYFVCLSKLTDNKSTLECVDCLKGKVVENLNHRKKSLSTKVIKKVTSASAGGR